jgi:hypothetical protein
MACTVTRPQPHREYLGILGSQSIRRRPCIRAGWFRAATAHRSPGVTKLGRKSLVSSSQGMEITPKLKGVPYVLGAVVSTTRSTRSAVDVVARV